MQTRRFGAALAVALSLTVLPVTAHAQRISSINFIGQATFPNNTIFSGTQVGGLSGITYDAANNRYFSISDDRSQINPARFYTLNINLADGTLDNGDVTFTNVTTLTQGGSNFAALSLDPEAIALAPDGQSVYITSEGDTNANQQPFINQFSLSGAQQSALAIPTKFAVAPTTGVRQNLAFESLTISPNGQRMTTATENALKQDGPAATLSNGSNARILTYNLGAGTPDAEYLYVTDPIAQAPVPAGQFATSGLVELLDLGGNDFLAIERSFSVGATGAGGTGNIVKLYQFSLNGATDISGFSALDPLPGGIVAVQKTLLLDLSTLGIPLDNIEGVTFGPQLANGQRSLILVSDNNFSTAPTAFTQFLAFGVTQSVAPEPGTIALTMLGLAVFGGRARRRAKHTKP
jgi:hypothetical protein